MIKEFKISELTAAILAINKTLADLDDSNRELTQNNIYESTFVGIKAAENLLKKYDLGEIDGLFNNIYNNIRDAKADSARGSIEFWKISLHTNIQRLETVIIHELVSQKYYLLSRNLIKYADVDSLKSEEFFKISGCFSEMKEATLCLAFGRDTACVFHCMCALENAWSKIESIAQVNGIKWSVSQLSFSQNWATLLNKLDCELCRIRNLPKLQQDKSIIEKLSNISNHMRSIKEAWRDDTMHARGSFDQKVAINIFETTRIFLNYLASI